MKYKRRGSKAKYISNSSEAKEKRRNIALKRRSTAVAVLLISAFALTRIGVFSVPSKVGGTLPKGIRNIAQSEGNGLIRSISEGIADFCFRYLRRGEKAEKASVRARENDDETTVRSDASSFLNGSEVPETDAEFGAEKTAAPQNTGFMPIMPCIGEISSDFGARVHPISGEESFHNGIDIASAEGSEIYSCEGGRVIAAEYNEYSGNYIKIEHQDGYVSSYSHLSRISAEVGDEVQRGSFIGLTGSTGIATGPHLHFEIVKNGEVQNPLSHIKG